ncbi:MAG: hypothetical protein ABIH01_03765 [Candidatus Omnitrophota bacterium]
MVKKMHNSVKLLLLLAFLFSIYSVSLNAKIERVDTEEIGRIVKMPVNEMLKDSPVKLVNIEDYDKIIRDKHDRPLVAFFYSDNNHESQRMASLLRYVSFEYKDHIHFIRVQTAEKGKPERDLAEDLYREFSLDRTPGILFYDNTRGALELENEKYVDPDFKEFRTPSLRTWNSYYKIVCQELDRVLSD